MILKRQSPLLKIFEVLLFTASIVIIGFYFDPIDPLLIHYDFSFLILWLAIVTLFYGLNLGLFMWLGFAVVSFLRYENDPVFTTVLLENLFFVFLFGFFFSNLHSEMDKYKIKTKYLGLRLRELTNAFFTLKISHDKLEAIYITQPASFRFVIAEILESSDHNTPEESAENTLKVLKKFFSVNTAMIWRVEGDNLSFLLASVGDIKPHVDKNDKLIAESLTHKRAIYLNNLENKEQTSYIYAIPFLDKREETVAMLIIKEIPFLFYHEDTLLKIDVVFTYIWTEYKKRASLDKIRANQQNAVSLKNENHERQDIVDFKLEVVRLNNILEGYKIESRIFSIATRNQSLDKEIEDFLYQSETLEVLDQYIAIECDGLFVHLILFPFVSLPDMHQKSKAMQHTLNTIENKLRVEQLEEELHEQLSTQHNSEMRIKHISVQNFNHLMEEEFRCV